MTGGWQTSKESAYVQASRARHATECFVAREELGIEGQDERRVDQLAAKMRGSRAQTPSLAYREIGDRGLERGYDRTIAPGRQLLPGLTRSIQRALKPDREPADRSR